MRSAIFCILASVVFACTAFSETNIVFPLESRDIKYISVSPKSLACYNVIIELFGPSEISLARVTRSNIGRRIDIYISNRQIVSMSIAYEVKSGMIEVGRYTNINDATNKITEILTALDESESTIELRK